MRRSIVRLIAPMAIGLAALGATPALAQFSESYNFLKAVRDADGDKVTKALQGSGSTLINTRDFNTGEAGLHIVVKRRDMTWLGFLLSRGANPNVKDNAGNTPMLQAALIGFQEGVEALAKYNAQVNLGNSRGETPLIIATQQRNIPMVRFLLANGGDPRQADRIAGKSAHDYAAEDSRSAAVLKILDEAPATAKPKPKMSGPGL